MLCTCRCGLPNFFICEEVHYFGGLVWENTLDMRIPYRKQIYSLTYKFMVLLYLRKVSIFLCCVTAISILYTGTCLEILSDFHTQDYGPLPYAANLQFVLCCCLRICICILGLHDSNLLFFSHCFCCFCCFCCLNRRRRYLVECALFSHQRF